MTNDNDLIRRGDAREALREVDAWTMPIAHAINSLPAVTVGVKPLVWQLEAAKGGPYYVAFDPLYGRQVEAPDEATCDAIDQTREARIRSALTATPRRDQGR